MAFNCKVFDGNGNLKKIIKIKEVLLEKENILFEQKSTKRAVEHIKTLKEPKCDLIRETKFYDRICVVCARSFTLGTLGQNIVHMNVKKNNFI